MDAGDVQRLARENADHMNDYLRDLRNWQRDIKVRDEALLKNQKPVSVRHFPPTRTSCPVNPVQQLKNDDQEKSKKISAYDYRAWDKFNADEECKKVDATERNDKVEVDEITEMRNKQEAVIAKDKGNDFFKKGELDKAIEWYTRGIELDTTNAALLANRAIAFLKKGRYLESETDCDSALSIDPTYVKVYQRRASARKALGKLDLAKEDLQKVLEIQDSGQVLRELDQVVALIKASESSDGTCLKPIIKPDHLCSKRAMKDIPIVEVGPEKVSREEPHVTQPTVADTKRDIEIPPVPKTAFQFQTDWRLLRNHHHLFYEYLKRIPHENYPRLFRQSLESPMLSDLLRTYADFYLENGLDTRGPLEALATTSRFSTLVMFMTTEDKQVTRRLFEHLRRATDNVEDIDALSKKYEL